MQKTASGIKHIIFTDNIWNLKTKENTDYAYTNIFLKRKNKGDGENSQCCFYFQGSFTTALITLFLKAIKKCTRSICIFIYNNIWKQIDVISQYTVFSQYTSSSLKMTRKEQFILSIGKIICYRIVFYTFYWQFLRYTFCFRSWTPSTHCVLNL